MLKLGQINFDSKKTPVDEKMFVEIRETLENISTTTIDKCFCSLLVFLLNNLSLEIDLTRLKSTKLSSNEKNSAELLLFMFERFQTKNLDEFLRLKLDSNRIFENCWILLKPSIENPSALKIFVQMVKSMREDLVVDCLETIFPVLINALENSSVEMKIFSLELIEKLENVCSPSELSLYNRSAVIL